MLKRNKWNAVNSLAIALLTGFMAYQMWVGNEHAETELDLRLSSVQISTEMLDDGTLRLSALSAAELLPGLYSVTPHFVERGDHLNDLGVIGSSVSLRAKQDLKDDDGVRTIILPSLYRAVCGDRQNERLCQTMNVDHYVVSYTIAGVPNAKIVSAS